MPRLKPPTLRWPAAASLVRRVCHRSISSTRVLHDEKDKPTHSDIPSFLRYAESVTLLRETTVFVGTMFEYTVQQALAKLGMTLTRTGGRGDLGIDLAGKWKIPRSSQESPIYPVIIQCKAEQVKASPKYMRELEGAIGGSDAIGFLASTGSCTPGTMKHMIMSQKPLGFCSVLSHEKGGYLQQLLWNNATAELLGPRLGVTTRYVPGILDDKEGILKEAVLTLDGTPLGELEGPGSFEEPEESEGSKSAEENATDHSGKC